MPFADYKMSRGLLEEIILAADGNCPSELSFQLHSLKIMAKTSKKMKMGILMKP